MSRIFVILVALLLGCIAGYMGGQRGIVIYDVKGFGTAYHRDWPTYGLPLAEYVAVSRAIDEGDLDGARRLLSTLIEVVMEDARQRLSVAPDADLVRIQHVIDIAEEYNREITRDTHEKGGGRGQPSN